MPRSRKLLLTVAAVGATSAVAGLGVFAAFTAQVTNNGNSIASGTVNLTEGSGGVAYYAVSNRGPGSSTVSCTRVTYTGTLPSTIKLYKPTAVTNGAAFNIRIERGSGLNPAVNAFPSCTGFTAAADVYNGTLGAFPTTFAAAPDARGSAWAQGDFVDYRITATVVDDPTPGAHQTAVTSGTHAYIWEAQNN